MEKKTVLVTGIGGNVGQGIIRNILHLVDYNIKLVGTNTQPMSAGNHLVDIFYQVPFGYEKKYISEMAKIVENESVDLIIPSTDFETAILSSNSSKLNTIIATAGENSTETYLDKYKSYIFHKKNIIPFAESCLPSEFIGQFTPAIAKPRKGRGSKGIIRNYSGKETFKDEEYIIQKMYEGVEITSAVYVSYITGEMAGVITMERTLENGATTFCKVTTEYDVAIEKMARSITLKTDIKGSFNIQSIVTKQGEIKPFEINCRISGTNSIRAHFGFEDVKYTIEELLYKIKLEKINTKSGEAYRLLTDVIYTEGKTSGTNSDKFITF